MIRPGMPEDMDANIFHRLAQPCLVLASKSAAGQCSVGQIGLVPAVAFARPKQLGPCILASGQSPRAKQKSSTASKVDHPGPDSPLNSYGPPKLTKGEAQT